MDDNSLATQTIFTASDRKPLQLTFFMQLKLPQSSHHGNQSREVSCYRDGKRLGRLSATVFCMCVRVCFMWTGDGADN